MMGNSKFGSGSWKIQGRNWDDSLILQHTAMPPLRRLIVEASPMAGRCYFLIICLFAFCGPSASFLISERRLCQPNIGRGHRTNRSIAWSLQAMSRRSAGWAILSGAAALFPGTAGAKGKIDESGIDRQKLYKGYQRLDYLL